MAEETPTLSIDALRAGRGDAMAELHALLLRRRASSCTGAARAPLRRAEDLATQAANDALVAVLAKLDTFRGASRFTTWAYKFVLLEAGVKARRRAWQGREVPLDDVALARRRAPAPQQSRGRRAAARGRATRCARR